MVAVELVAGAIGVRADVVRAPRARTVLTRALHGRPQLHLHAAPTVVPVRNNDLLQPPLDTNTHRIGLIKCIYAL